MDPARHQGHRAKLCWMLLAAGTAVPDPTDLWAEAYTVATEIDSPVLRSQVRRLADERGVRLPLGRPRERRLSEVQTQVVEMVEQGMTNRQIARDLQVSEKTVENISHACSSSSGVAPGTGWPPPGSEPGPTSTTAARAPCAVRFLSNVLRSSETRP